MKIREINLFEGIGAHHHGPAQRLVEAIVHAVDQVGQVVHKVPERQCGAGVKDLKWENMELVYKLTKAKYCKL